MSDRLMTAKVLHRAAELVEQGWCRINLAECDEVAGQIDVMDPRAVRWCMNGALWRAEAELDHFAAWYLVQSMIPQGCISHWNDAPGRNADQVAAKLREIADHAEGVRP